MFKFLVYIMKRLKNTFQCLVFCFSILVCKHFLCFLFVRLKDFFRWLSCVFHSLNWMMLFRVSWRENIMQSSRGEEGIISVTIVIAACFHFGVLLVLKASSPSS